jgi:hypothetical protein
MGNVENKKLLEKYNLNITDSSEKANRLINYFPGYPKIRKTDRNKFRRSLFKDYFDNNILKLSQEVVKRVLKDEHNNPSNINFMYSTIPSILFNNENFELFENIQLFLDNGSKGKSADDKNLKKFQKAKIKEYEEFIKTGKRSPDNIYDKPVNKVNHHRIPIPAKSKANHSPDKSVIKNVNNNRTPQRSSKTANISRDNSVDKSYINNNVSSHYLKQKLSKSPKVKTVVYKPDIVYNTNHYIKAKTINSSGNEDNNTTFTKIPKNNDIIAVNEVLNKISYLQANKVSYADLIKKRNTNQDLILSHYNTENSTSYNQSSRNSPGDYDKDLILSKNIIAHKLQEVNNNKDINNININISEVKIINNEDRNSNTKRVERNKIDDLGFKYATDYQNYIKNDSIYKSKSKDKEVVGLDNIEERVKEKARVSLEKMKNSARANESAMASSIKRESTRESTKPGAVINSNRTTLKVKEVGNNLNNITNNNKVINNSNIIKTMTGNTPKGDQSIVTKQNPNLAKLNKLRNKPNHNFNKSPISNLREPLKEFTDTLKLDYKGETISEQKSDSYNSQSDIHTEIKRNTPVFNKPGHGHRRSNSFGGYTGGIDFEPKFGAGALNPIEEGEKFSFRNKQEEEIGIKYIPSKVMVAKTDSSKIKNNYFRLFK